MVRLHRDNKRTLRAFAKKAGFKSESEWFDTLVTEKAKKLWEISPKRPSALA